jgi:hypothetical protein
MNNLQYHRHDQYQFQNDMHLQNRNPASRHMHVRFSEEPRPTNFNRQPSAKVERNDLRVPNERLPHAQPSSMHLYPYNSVEDELSRRLDDVLGPASRGDSSSPQSYHRDKPEKRAQSVYVDTNPNVHHANMQSYNENTYTNTQAPGHANSQHPHYVNMQYSQKTGADGSHPKSFWPSPSMSANNSLSGDSSSSYETRHYHPSHSTPHYPPQYTSLPGHANRPKTDSASRPAAGAADPEPQKQYKVWVPPAQTAENVQPVKPKRKVIKPPMSKASDAAAKLV